MKTRVVQDGRDDGGAAALAPPPPAAERPPHGSTGRVVGGAVAATIGLAALAGGGALVGVHATQRDADGYYTADPVELTTPTRALVADAVDVDLGGVTRLLDDGRLGDLRVSATGARDGPVFVGIGPRDDVAAYLDGVPQASADFGDGGVPLQPTAGARAPAPPAAQTFWSRSASGTGRQTIVWPVDAGDWSAVVMNADGSAGIAVESELGVRTDGVLWLAIAALAVGGGLAALGTALIVTGRRRPRHATREDP
ncbi:MAG TPA: hypothetical protein PKD59_05310 [Miltoncostaeaceae bacterium]|nr:hypothetical protein [Miltoncostaeaceae bacterium]